MTEIDPQTFSADDRALLTWLESHDEACPACRYSLRSLTTTTCPECGTLLRLGVAAPHLNLWWWLLAILSFALALGFDGVVVVVMGLAIVFAGGTPPPGALVAYSVFIALAVISAVAILGLVRRRSRWVRMSTERQRWIAIGVFVLVGAVHAAFGLILTRVI